MIDKRLAEWLASGDTGISSEAIAFYLAAGITPRAWSTPCDPSDLGRCLRLLDKIPEFAPRIGEMANVGGEWAVFAERWHEMAASMIEEVGIDWSKGRKAPKTYALMKAVEHQARERAETTGEYIKLGSGMTMRFGA